MTTSSRLSQAVTYVLVVAAIVLGAQLVLSTAFGSSPFYVVVSSSMTPTLKVGDMVVVENVPFDTIHVNDVIVYVTPTPMGGCEGLVVVHRVVGISSDGGLITQGDNRATNPRPDEPTEWPYVHAQCVKGKVMLAVPYLGEVSLMFPPPINYVLVLMILVIIFTTEFFGGRRGTPVPPEPEARA
jgi:signal peptidase